MASLSTRNLGIIRSVVSIVSSFVLLTWLIQNMYIETDMISVILEIIAVHLERMMDHLIRIEHHPTFTDTEWAKERRVRFVEPDDTDIDTVPNTNVEHLYEVITVPEHMTEPEPRTTLNIFRKLFKKQ